MIKMKSFSDSKKNHCWNKARKRRDKDSSGETYRTGAANALIKYQDYGNANSKYGWTIDHKKPTSLGGTDANSNIRAMHWKNNIAKGNDYYKDSSGNNYYRALVYNKEKDTNVTNKKGMSFTKNEAIDQ